MLPPRVSVARPHESDGKRTSSAQASLARPRKIAPPTPQTGAIGQSTAAWFCIGLARGVMLVTVCLWTKEELSSARNADILSRIGELIPTACRSITPRCRICDHLASRWCGFCGSPMCAAHSVTITDVGEICDECLHEWAAQQTAEPAEQQFGHPAPDAAAASRAAQPEPAHAGSVVERAPAQCSDDEHVEEEAFGPGFGLSANSGSAHSLKGNEATRGRHPTKANESAGSGPEPSPKGSEDHCIEKAGPPRLAVGIADHGSSEIATIPRPPASIGLCGNPCWFVNDCGGHCNIRFNFGATHAVCLCQPCRDEVTWSAPRKTATPCSDAIAIARHHESDRKRNLDGPGDSSQAADGTAAQEQPCPDGRECCRPPRHPLGHLSAVRDCLLCRGPTRQPPTRRPLPDPPDFGAPFLAAPRTPPSEAPPAPPSSSAGAAMGDAEGSNQP